VVFLHGSLTRGTPLPIEGCPMAVLPVAIVDDVMLKFHLKSCTSNQNDKLSSQKFPYKNLWNNNCRAGSSRM